jgi:hypothetical protein
MIRKAIYSFAVVGLLGGFVTESSAATINLDSELSSFNLLENTNQGLSLDCSFAAFESIDVNTESGMFTDIYIPGLSSTMELGAPKLPVLSRIISVPLGATVNALARSSSTEIIDLLANGFEYPLMPAQPSLMKNQTAVDVPFEYNAAAYISSGFDSHPVVSVEELGIMRGLRLFRLAIEPVQYNPVDEELLVHNDIQVDVEFIGADWQATENLRDVTRSPFYETTYAKGVLNYEPEPSRDTITEYPIKYVIVADPMFTSQLQPFIEWKTKKGFEVIVGYTNDPAVGSTTTSIKAWLQGLYNSATPTSPAPSFILYVGDDSEVPAYSGTTGSHSTDLNYVLYSGNDLLPEVFYGRFSARTTAELQPQIDKTLEYEQYLMPDPSFLSEVVLIAGVDGSWAPTHGNGQINYGTIHYFNAAHGITDHTWLYPASDAAGAAGEIIAAVSAGAGYVNYTAHGSQTSWADPSFTIPDIYSLANDGKYPTVVGNCCVTNSFQIGECFGEAWLRAPNKGALGYIGGSNNTLWNEDYWWGVGNGTTSGIGDGETYESTGIGCYDGLFHDHGENTTDWYTTQGAMQVCGNLAVTEAGSSSSDYYWEIYHLMGDPSISTYLGIPTVNTVTYPSTIFIGNGSIDITADPYSYAALSFEGVLVASGLVDSSGNLQLNFAPLTVPGEADIVITAQNRQPVINTVQVIPNDGAFVTLNSYSPHTVNVGNNVSLDVTLENIGSVDALSVSTVLNSGDAAISINDASETFGTINAGTTASANGAFSFDVANGTADQHTVQCPLLVSGTARDTWTSYVNLLINAPELSAGYAEVLDPAPNGNANGIIDAGETVEIRVPLNNTGHLASASGTATLASTSSDVTIIDGNDAVASISIGGSTFASFEVAVDASALIGSPIPFNFVLDSGEYDVIQSFTLTVGLIVEDFESANFVNLPWDLLGNANWTIDGSAPYESQYSAKSGTITHDQASTLSLSANVLAAGDLSFSYKVSSESNYDYLHFYIDGVDQDAWSGLVDWTTATYPVTTGQHTFAWSYTKDGSVNTNSDCAWVDYIEFPGMSLPEPPAIALSSTEVDFMMAAGSLDTEVLVVSNASSANLGWNAVVEFVEPMLVSQTALKLGKDEIDPRQSTMTRDSGGPDDYGYFWHDSNEAGGPEYSWIDISGVGSVIPSPSDDDNDGPYDLGFNFEFYGTSFSSLRVCSNGWLSFTSTATDYSNDPIGTVDEPNNLLAPFWDDMNPVDGGTISYYQDTANQRFVVSWDGVPHYSTGNPETFQAILYADGRIVYQYHTIVTNNSCTVGIENSDASNGLQVINNDQGDYLQSGMAIEFYFEEPVAPWLVLRETTGTIEGIGQADVHFDFSTMNLVDGVYYANVTVTSNDPDDSVIEIPVTLTVGELSLEAPTITIDSPSACTTMISWDAVPNATYYKIYVADQLDGEWVLLNTTTYLFYQFDCALAETVAIYRVTAASE